jgi:hypothetical protein
VSFAKAYPTVVRCSDHQRVDARHVCAWGQKRQPDVHRTMIRDD